MLAQINIGDKFLGTGKFLTDPKNIGKLVTNLLTGSLAIAGIILLLLLIAGGIGIIAGAGSQNPEQIEKGKKAATSALIGFIVVFAAYWIVQLVESFTGLPLLK